MPMLDPKITRGGVIRSQIVRHQIFRQEAILLQEFAHQFQRCGLIPLGLDQDIQNLSFAIDGAPQINQTTINFQIDFAQMPGCVWLRPALVKIGRDPGSKMIDPSSHGFIGDCDSAFRQQILDVAEAQSVSGVQPDRLLNDHGRKAVTGVADFGHHEG
jgi:hypothetical protein